MARKTVWLCVNCLIVAALLLVSCAPAVTEEEEVAETPTEEEIAPSQEEAAPPAVEEEEAAPPVERVAATIDGIRFEPESTGKTATGLLLWTNTGDATHDFDVMLYVISTAGARYGPVQVEQDVRVEPQTSAITGLRLDFEGLPSGNYRVSVDVYDAETDELVTSQIFPTLLALEAEKEAAVAEIPSAPPPTLTLTQMLLQTVIDPPGGGTVRPPSGTYVRGAMVYLRATPSSGYRFVSWSGDVPEGLELSPDICITMDQDRTLQANFEPISTPTPTVTPGVSVTLDTERSASAVVPTSGGTVSTSATDGSRFTLSLPPDASLDTREISLTPVSAIEGLPLSGDLVAAVQLEPEGLSLLKPATLTIELPAPVPAEDLMGFAYHGSGEGFYLTPLEVNGTTLTFQLTHFSGVGAAEGTAADCEAIEERGLLPEDRAQQRLACVLKNAGNNPENLSNEDLEVIEDIFRDWYLASVQPNIDAANQCWLEANSLEDCNTANTLMTVATNEYLKWKFNLDMASTVHFSIEDELANEIETALGTLAMAIQNAINRLDVLCLATSNREEKESLLKYLLALEVFPQALGLGEDIPVDLGACCDGFLSKVAYQVEVSPASEQLGVGESCQLTVTVKNYFLEIIEDPVIAWSSSDYSVASVDASGLVTGEGQGTAAITATVDGQTDWATITVEEVQSTEIASISVSPEYWELEVGKYKQLVVEVRNADGNLLGGRAVAWSSSDDSVASVDASGLVKSEGEGTATITATADGHSDSATITVVASPGEPEVGDSPEEPDYSIEGTWEGEFTTAVWTRDFAVVGPNSIQAISVEANWVRIVVTGDVFSVTAEYIYTRDTGCKRREHREKYFSGTGIVSNQGQLIIDPDAGTGEGTFTDVSWAIHTQWSEGNWTFICHDYHNEGNWPLECGIGLGNWDYQDYGTGISYNGFGLFGSIQTYTFTTTRVTVERQAQRKSPARVIVGLWPVWLFMAVCPSNGTRKEFWLQEGHVRSGRD